MVPYIKKKKIETVPNDTLPIIAKKQLNRSICRTNI